MHSQGLRYYRKGAGEPLLLIHGVGLCAESWYKQLDYLSQYYEVIAIDLPGHGDSDPLSSQSPDVSSYADVIVNVIHELYNCRVHIIGHSLGALIALHLASHQAEICRSLTALTSVYQRSNAASKAVQQRATTLASEKITDVAMTPLLRWFPVSDPESNAEYIDHCARWLNDANTKQYAAAYHAFANATDLADQSIKEITCPALFLTGELDPNSTPEMSNALAQLTPAGAVAIIKNARHMLQLTHASEVNHTIHEFLADQEQHTAEILL